ncbi:MAG: choice-of-anchor D domain-containing protein [Deferribacteres bacterium]|nr:choice-of-anchor D domain-containing protein [Deferribacteres bacterium]
MKSRNSYLILGVLMIALLMPSSAGAAWRTGCVDCPRLFYRIDMRTLAVDSSGNPHIVYGGGGWIGDGVYYAYYDGDSWHIETVDDRGGGTLSIAIDSSDKAHISYDGSGGLKHATNASGSWVIETVDIEGGGRPSIAIDSSDKIHISYGSSPLKYATNASGSWVIETVEDVGAWSNSIAADSSGNVHITYRYSTADSKDYILKYATNASGSWVTEIIDSDGRVGEHHSIAVDSSDKVHIAYDYYLYLKYATNASGSWVTEIVDSDGRVGESNSIAVDSSDNVHISYGDYTSYPYYQLKYATNASGSWVTEIVDDSAVLSIFSRTSIAVDSSDNVHISYVHDSPIPTYIFPKFYLRYATNASGSWVTETVDSGRKVSKYSSVAMDSTGNAHISYVSDEGLIHMTNNVGSWITEVVVSGLGSWPNSIAVDSADNVHIGYLGDQGLIHVTNEQGSWASEIVDTNGGISNSIVIDSSDKVHISYLSHYEDKAYPNEYLKYATNASGSWVTETVLVGAAGEYFHNSIALDSSDKVHITYRDAYWLVLPSNINHVTNASGSWITEVVDRDGMAPSIAIDSADNVHISYFYPVYYSSYRYLKHATNASGSWVNEVVDNTGSPSFIAIDSADNVHISYSNAQSLMYMTNASGSWVSETVDSDAGEVISMAMDSTDKVYIVYYDRFHFDLKYATNKPLPDISVTDSVDPADDLQIPFGEVRGGRSPSRTATVTNIADSGSENLVISAVYLTGANPEQFEIWKDNCSDTALASSGSCTIRVVFTPEEEGVYSARLGIDSNDPDTPTVYVKLTGTSVAKRKQGRR